MAFLRTRQSKLEIPLRRASNTRALEATSRTSKLRRLDTPLPSSL
jgi:hypothetical protein